VNVWLPHHLALRLGVGLDSDMSAPPTADLIQEALALHRRGAVSEAAAGYAEVLRADPANADAHYYLAMISCQHGRFAEGADLVRQSLAIDPRQPRAHVLLGRAMSALGRPAEALASFDQAIALAPELAQAHGNRANVLSDLGRTADAIGGYDRALALAPDSIEDWFNRGLALAAIDRHVEAISSFDRALAIRPDFVNAHLQRANVLAKLARFAAAVEACDRALAIKPAEADALVIKARALCEMGRPGDALACCEAALAVSSASVDALVVRGVALGTLGRLEDSLASLDRALSIKPDSVDALANRGKTLNALGDYAGARQCLNLALTHKPDNVVALINCGVANFELQKIPEALDWFDRAVAADPESADAHCSRGLALNNLRRYGEAIESFERARALDRGDSRVLGELAKAYGYVCDWPGLEKITGELIGQVGRSPIDPFLLLSIDCSPEQQLACAQRWLAEVIGPRRNQVDARSPAGVEKIRIAYLSADFRAHPTSYLLADLIERHDRNRFEVIGVSFGVDDGSEMRRRMETAFDRFHDATNESDLGIARLLHDSGVDIAIDLMGHTQFARLGVLAYRPAPIQVNFLGFPGTTGAGFMDYMVADKVVLPPEEQQCYSERIVYLPGCYQVTDAKRQIGRSPMSRAEAGLPDAGFVYCSFNNSFKLTPRIFDVWMRLLHAAEGSVLWLLASSDLAMANLRREAAARGIDPQRLVFAPRMAPAEHLARHRMADLFLDTVPCNAHTTASDALWAGLPMVTLKGETFTGRVAASLLHAVGLPELVTNSLEEYGALARSLSSNRVLLAAIRQKLQDNLRTAPLFDTDRYRRHIEQAYTTMIDIWRRGENPRSFSVEPM
jgi:protein O-GlcNAc transferase